MPHTDAKHWRYRAAEALLLAADTHEEMSRWLLIQIAVGYNCLAKQAEQQAVKTGSGEGVCVKGSRGRRARNPHGPI